MYAKYVIQIDQGDYIQARGGYDWGRAEHPVNATQYDSEEEAREAARQYQIESLVRSIDEF